MSLRHLVVNFWLVLALASPGYGAVLVDVSRDVSASAFASFAEVSSDEDADGTDSSALGDFLEAAVVSAGVGDTVNASAEALQDSSVVLSPGGGIGIEGGGSSGVAFDVMDPGFPSRAQGTGDTTLSILFEVTEATPVVLAIALSAELSQLSLFAATGGVSADVSASASLTGATTGLVFDRDVADATAGDGAVLDDFSVDGVLLPDAYRLDLQASTFLLGLEDAAGFATASFGVSLQLVPEPSSAALLAMGAAALAIAARRRRA